jgi:hypothetical protein
MDIHTNINESDFSRPLKMSDFMTSCSTEKKRNNRKEKDNVLDQREYSHTQKIKP